jgi:hypothetical protein
MPSYRYKPSKPVAVFSALVGAGMIVFVLLSFDEAPKGFIALWCVAAAGIIGLNVWAAFSEKGSLASWSSSGKPPFASDDQGGSDRHDAA